MQTDGSLEHIRAEAVNTAWGNKMDLVAAFVLGAVCHWAWGKFGGKAL